MQRLKILNLYKSLTREVRTDKTLFNLIRNEFRQSKVTSSKYCKEENEQFFIANAYLSYLRNTREYSFLKSKYAKGERSIEESANIVGLRLPKQYHDEKQE
jgi:hypothetical protein